MSAKKNRSYIEKPSSGKSRKSKRWIKRILIGLFILVLLSILAVISLVVVLPKIYPTPDLNTLLKEKPWQVSIVYSDAGEEVGEFAKENRIPVSISKIPKDLRNAIVAVEDKNFYKHGGIDPMGIARAVWKNIESGRKGQGGSTITQQLSRILYLSREKTLIRKINEILIALQISKKYTKDQVLELYLNRIYLGHGSYGVEAAASLYFGKSVDKLNLPECAMLAGLPQMPEVYSPFRNMTKARQRRSQVLDRMAEEGFITKKQAQRAKLSPIILSKRREQFTAASYFIEQIRRQMVEDPNYGYTALYQEGLRVYSTMNAKYQKVAHEILRAHLELFEKNQQNRINAIAKNKKYELKPNAKVFAKMVKIISSHKWRVTISGQPAELILPPELNYLKPENIIKPDNYLPVQILAIDTKKQLLLRFISEPHIQGALIAIDPKTGQIKAMVGGYSYEESEYNRAIQAYRQPGSAFKPIVYATAIDNGFVPTDILIDSPISFKNWIPQNYDRKFLGEITLRYALEQSRNVPTVKLAQRLGIDRIIEYAHRLGIQDTENRKLNHDLTLALGSMEVTPVELTSVYVVLANGGKWYQPESLRYITDAKGTKVDEYQILSQDALSPQTCYILTDMLKGVIKRGTAAYSVGEYFHRPAAGKTGTTSDFSDAWFVGYTPDLVVCTWMGYDQRKSLGPRMTGGMVAAPMWRDFMLNITANDTTAADFPVPDGVVFADICSASDKLATAQCFAAVEQLQKDNDPAKARAIRIIKEVFKTGTEPKEYCTSDHNVANLHILPEAQDAESPADAAMTEEH